MEIKKALWKIKSGEKRKFAVKFVQSSQIIKKDYSRARTFKARMDNIEEEVKTDSESHYG